jgi:hypothetical protein
MLTPIVSRVPKRVLFNLNGILNSSVRCFADDRKPKTLEYQNRLGKLPVPDLRDTLNKFLTTAEPHLTKSEFKGIPFHLQIIRSVDANWGRGF